MEGYGFKPAGDLSLGERVRLSDGTTCEIENIILEHLTTPTEVYNLNVEDWHTYYVAERGVLVHNITKVTAAGTQCGVEVPKNTTLKDGKINNVNDIAAETPKVNAPEVGDGVGGNPSSEYSVTFDNWEDMKQYYRNTDTKVTKFLKNNKPKYSPDIKGWFEEKGSITIEKVNGKNIWTYNSPTGESVSYIDGYVKFPDKYLHPDIKEINIGEFTGDRGKDIDKLLVILEEKYGLYEIPDGYIVHHDTENGILQLVQKNIHEMFTHIGGHSIYK